MYKEEHSSKWLFLYRTESLKILKELTTGKTDDVDFKLILNEYLWIKLFLFGNLSEFKYVKSKEYASNISQKRRKCFIY